MKYIFLIFLVARSVNTALQTCDEIRNYCPKVSSGEYWINGKQTNGKSMKLYCDMETDNIGIHFGKGKFSFDYYIHILNISRVQDYPERIIQISTPETTHATRNNTADIKTFNDHWSTFAKIILPIRSLLHD